MLMRTARTLIIRAAIDPKRFCECVATWEMAQQAPMAMDALTAGSVASSNFSSMVWWGSASEALAMSAKLGSHGGKDIAKVMAITNGSGKGGDRSNR